MRKFIESFAKEHLVCLVMKGNDVTQTDDAGMVRALEREEVLNPVKYIPKLNTYGTRDEAQMNFQQDIKGFFNQRRAKRLFWLKYPETKHTKNGYLVTANFTVEF